MSPCEFETARLTIRLGAIVENYRTLARLAGPAAVGAVVKADAYGLGAERVAMSLSANAGCDTFFVARLEEGVRLRPVLRAARIFVLDGAQAEAVPALIGHRLTPVLNSLADVAAWSAAARETRTTLDAALHIDTGMNRLGMPADELAILAAEAGKRLAGLRLVLIMSHLACAEDPDAAMNRVQLDRFKTALEILPTAPASLASTGGALLGREYFFDMVRPGLGLYGGNPQLTRPNPFRPVATLTGRVLQVHRVDRGESVGYGATFRAGEPTVVATAALGYADGLMRAIGNRGKGAIDGVRVPMVGRVSMDLITVDVSAIPDVRAGARIEFVGDTITLEDAAQAAGTASYEILTALSHRAPRHYVDGSQ